MNRRKIVIQNIPDNTVLSMILSDLEMEKREKGKKYSECLKDRILTYLDNTKITTKTLCSKTGLSQPTISRWKKERSFARDVMSEDILSDKGLSPIPEKEEKIIEVVPPKAEPKAIIKVDGFEVEIPISYLGETIKQLRN